MNSYLGQGRDIAQVIFGIGDALDIDGLGAVVDGSCECLWCCLSYPLDANTELLECDCNTVQLAFWTGRECTYL